MEKERRKLLKQLEDKEKMIASINLYYRLKRLAQKL